MMPCDNLSATFLFTLVWQPQWLSFSFSVSSSQKVLARAVPSVCYVLLNIQIWVNLSHSPAISFSPLSLGHFLRYLLSLTLVPFPPCTHFSLYYILYGIYVMDMALQSDCKSIEQGFIFFTITSQTYPRIWQILWINEWVLKIRNLCLQKEL